MGEENLALFRAEFNRSLRVESRPERLTSEAGAVVLREVLERLGLVDWLVGRLVDRRDPELITHPLSELLHTALLLLGQGWRDQDDADALRHDAVFHHPIFSPTGLAYFLGEITRTFWRGEFVWHLEPVASPAADLFYVGSTGVFLAASAVALWQGTSDVHRRVVLSMSFFV